MRLFTDKKGMETWQLVLIILAVLLLVFLIFWFSVLGTELGDLLKKLGGIF
jgi:type VI protein secretion system component VasF